MASGKAEISINRSPDEVWKLLREFGGLADWMPGIDTCVVDGDVRTLGMMGMEVKERLEKLDDDNRVIAYSLFEAPIPNLESHLCTISVSPEGNGARVTWNVEVFPDDLLGIFLPIYEGSIGEIKKKLES